MVLLYNYLPALAKATTARAYCPRIGRPPSMSFFQPASVEDLLNYRLNRLLASSGAMVTRLCEGRYGITRREWRLICVLSEHGAMSPSQLAAHAHLERPRISRHVSDLVAKKLVERAVDPLDGRRALVHVTADGRALHAELFPLSVELNNRVLAVLTPGERTVLDATLAKLTTAADELVLAPPVPEKADRHAGGRRRDTVSRLDELSSWLPNPKG